MSQKQYECIECGEIFSETTIGSELICPECGSHIEQYNIENSSKDIKREAQKHSIADSTVQDEKYTGFFAPEKKGIDNGVAGGFFMIIIALVWFVGGYAAGYIFYYPPILGIIGLYAVLKGLATGNWSGEKINGV